jgi:hypothetical protein
MNLWAYVTAAYAGSALLYLAYFLYLRRQEARLESRLPEGGGRG